MFLSPGKGPVAEGGGSTLQGGPQAAAPEELHHLHHVPAAPAGAGI